MVEVWRRFKDFAHRFLINPPLAPSSLGGGMGLQMADHLHKEDFLEVNVISVIQHK